MGYPHTFYRVSIWSKLFGRTTPASVGVASPYAPPSDLVTFALAEILGQQADSGAVTRETALRVPAVKRAHGIHCSFVAGLQFYEMDGDARAAEQPGWLTNSASGISPYHRMYGITSDLFMSGWACIAFTEDMSDAVHVPMGWWGVDNAGEPVITNTAVPARYSRPVAISLGYGDNGILVDGVASIRAALLIEKAWIDRVENPVPQTDLHFTDPKYDDLSRKEKRKIVDDYNENRRRGGGSTAVTQSFVEVRALGTVSADLFEKGRNAVRLDLANHGAVPASIVEGSKDSGTDVKYTGVKDGATRNELYDFGTKRFVQAIEARLSLDDVCLSGRSIRADLSTALAAPTPDTNPTSAD